MGTKKRSRLLVLFKKTLCLPKLFPLFRQIFWRLEAYSSNELTKLDINFWNPLPYRNAGKCPQLPQRPACTLTYVYEKIYALQKLLQEVFLAYIHHLKALRVYTVSARRKINRNKAHIKLYLKEAHLIWFLVYDQACQHDDTLIQTIFA